MWYTWLGFALSAILSPFVNRMVNNGSISSWWTLVPSFGLAINWSLTARYHKGSMANVGLIFDIFATTAWVAVFALIGDKTTPGTFLGLAFLILGLLSIRYF